MHMVKVGHFSRERRGGRVTVPVEEFSAIMYSFLLVASLLIGLSRAANEVGC